VGELLACGRCGHRRDSHGRRGHGACRARAVTEAGVAAGASVIAQTPPDLQSVVLNVALALPGMTENCGCKRYRKRPAPEGGDRG